MSAFEYTSVLASIIVGLALVDVLVSLNRLIRAGPRVQWHWAAPAASALVFLTVIQIWWSLYQPGEAPLTIGAFLPVLVELILLFVLAAAALPDEVPAEGVDLRRYYDRNGRYFWSLFAAALAWPLALAAVEAARHPDRLAELLDGRLVDLVVLLVFGSLILVRRLWWHAIAMGFLFLGPIGWLSRSLG